LNVVELVVRRCGSVRTTSPACYALRLRIRRRPGDHGSGELVVELSKRPWPGNVRELRNACERMVILCRATK